ncbi:hypothetical protein [Alsobacter sp. SYSU BS001988]
MSGESEALVLGKASCETCRLRTHKIEETALKGLSILRAKLRLRRKDRTPPFVDLDTTDEDGLKRKTRVDLNSLPLIPVILPEYKPATCFTLSGPEMPVLHCTNGSTDFYHLLGGAGKSYTSGIFHLPSFSEMLMKISHGIIVSRIGLADFKPFISDVDFDDLTSCLKYVGGIDARDLPSKFLHEFSLSKQKSPGGGYYYVVHIRLFAMLGTPTNYAVVGWTMDPTPCSEYLSISLGS